MKCRKIVKAAFIWMILGLGMNLFTGCGGKTVDYDVGSETENAQEERNGGKKGLKQFAGVPAWKKELTVALGKKETIVTFQINADISVPKAEQMSVLEVKEPEFDAAYKEKIAERIFGSEEIYYNDIPHLPKAELEERYAYWEEHPSAFYNTEEWEETLAACEEAMESEGEEGKNAYMPVDGFTGNEYLGMRDGVSYELNFVERTNERDPYQPVRHRTKEISLVPKDIRQICPQELRQEEAVYCKPGAFQISDNQCSLSEEEAKEKAQDFVDTLDLDYPVCVYARPLIWSWGYNLITQRVIDMQNYHDEDVVNGYVFYYDLGIEDVSFVDFGAEESYLSLYNKKKDTEETRYSMEARMEVYVTDDGVIQMKAYNPLEITGMSRDVELLSLNTVLDILEEQLTERAGRFRFNISRSGEKVRMNGMDLIYFRVRDEKNPGAYSYVPAWRLASVERDELEHTVECIEPVLINAIDGSEIDLFNEM